MAAAARLLDRKTALVHPPSPYYLFYLCSPSVLTHPPTDSCPLCRQVTPTLAVCVHVSDKNHEIAGVAPFRQQTQQESKRKGMREFNFCTAKCSECDLIVIQRWGLGVQILLVTALQTSQSLTRIYTQKNVNKNEVQHASSNMDFSMLDGVYITLQSRVMDVTATVVIEIILPHLLSWE